MREILFRGFHPCDGPDTIVVDGEKVVGRWVQGSLVSFADGGRAILPSKTVVLQQEGTTLLSTKESLEVIPSTVGQYIGLTDSSGQKVFEGDILKFTDRLNDYEWTGRIEFGNPNGGYTWGYQIVHLSGPKPNIDTLCWFDMEEGGAYSEVIGTIFDEEAQHDN